MGKGDEIRTVIDEIVDTVNKKGSLRVKEIKETYGLENKDIEKLMDILEQSHLVRISYSLLSFDQTTLWSIGSAGGKALAAVRDKKYVTTLVLLEDIEKTLAGADARLSRTKLELLKRLERAKQDIIEIEQARTGEKTQKEIDNINRVLASIREDSKGIEEKLKMINKSAKELEEQMRKLRSLKTGG